MEALRALDLVHQPQQLGRHMAAVADGLHGKFVVQQRRLAGPDLGIVIAVGEHGDGVVDVGDVGKAGLHRPHHGLIVRVGVAHGKEHALGREPAGHIQHAVDLRRGGDAPHCARFHDGHVILRAGRIQKRRILRARALGIEVASLQMRAQHPRAVVALLHGPCNVLNRRKYGFRRGGSRGGQYGGGAMEGVEARGAVERLRRGIKEGRAIASVDVDVHKARAQIVTPAVDALPGRLKIIAPEQAGDFSVLHGKSARIDLLRRDQSSIVERGFHEIAPPLPHSF